MLGAEIFLFVLVGMAVDVRYAVPAGIPVILLSASALCFRMLGVFLSLMGTGFNRKEKLFCMMAYTPKATVQAAIGTIPLSMGLACGNVVLTAAVAHSTGAAKELIQRIKSGEANYHFVEVMACPSGCVNGGGQPIVEAFKRLDVDPRAARAVGLYAEDEAKAIRKSHENPDIQKLYKEFLGEPNGHKAHELLHTHYTDRSAK